MGKITCPICNKSQGGFIQSFSIHTEEQNKYEVCFECGNLFNIIKSNDDWDIKQEYVDTMSKKISDSKTVPNDLKGYIETFLVPDEVELERRDKQLKAAIEVENREKRIAEEKAKEEARKIEYQRLLNSVMVTTGYNFEGHNIIKYNGIISSESSVGTGLLSEAFIEAADFWGDESSIYTSKLSKAKAQALTRLKHNALHTNSNAIIGVDFDIYTLSNNTIVVSANGTAVTIN